MRRAAAAISHASKAATAVCPVAAPTKKAPSAPSRVTLKYEKAEGEEGALAAAKATATAPPHWREWLSLIEKMRERRDAPVDMMGAGASSSSPSIMESGGYADAVLFAECCYDDGSSVREKVTAPTHLSASGAAVSWCCCDSDA
jgi:hypothetical protein